MRLSLIAALTPCALAACLAAPATAAAQSTRQQIDSAVNLYVAFQVEAARPILQRIISPGYLQQVSSAEKAEALKYLGASYAVLASQDSAITYFMGALDHDPFTDLDPTKFAGAELAAFGEAKKRLFKVAIRPLPGPKVVQRDTAPIRFDFITTQRANVQVELAGPDTIVLFEGPNEGARAVQWKGVLNTGAYARAGVYQLRIRGQNAGQAQPLTESMTLRIEHVFEPLEETLPELDPNRELLPERIRPSEPWVDLVKGAAVAAVAVGLPLVALKTSDIAWTPHAGATAFVGLTSASVSFWYRRAHPQIRQNVAENTRRRNLRSEFNAGVLARNQGRLERTLLIVAPVTGLGQ
jgi:hypothetical protein